MASPDTSECEEEVKLHWYTDAEGVVGDPGQCEVARIEVDPALPPLFWVIEPTGREDLFIVSGYWGDHAPSYRFVAPTVAWAKVMIQRQLQIEKYPALERSPDAQHPQADVAASDAGDRGTTHPHLPPGA